MTVDNVVSYTAKECSQFLCSSQIVPMVTKAVDVLEHKNLYECIKRSDNVPGDVLRRMKLKHESSPRLFDIWRNQMSNDINDYI